ncbi:MAG: hypothetical protein Q8N88_06800 [Nanoarchaeota archaeon]|nr:hypothetical protein [Nanoarchaeota archaeon]
MKGDREKKFWMTALDVFVIFSLGILNGRELQKYYYRPQNKDLLGNSRAVDPNETYVTINGVNYYAVVDGNSIENYFGKAIGGIG